MDDKTIAARISGERERVLKNIAAQETLPDSVWWLSFADEGGFRGAVIAHGEEFLEALMRVNLLGINPHGECQGMGPIPADVIPEKWLNRVLTKAECEEFDREMSEREGQ